MFNFIIRYICLLTLMLSCREAMGLTQAIDASGICARPVHAKGITGAGVNIGLLSAGNVRAGHAAFSRDNGAAVANYDFTGSGLSRSSHDTHMAGIILSAGSDSHPNQIGVAPGAGIHSARFSNKQLYPSKVSQALDTLIEKHHCRVIMTGIQLTKDIVPADGNSRWTKLYDYYADTYDVIFTTAAGNSSPLVTVFGDGYNGITTAGMVKSDPNGVYDTIGAICNPGPTADGRKKPDLAAPTHGLIAPTSSGDDHWTTLDPEGRGLTSYAVPHTAGVAALLLETAAKSSVKNDDKSEVIKAVIINAADPTAFNGGLATTAMSDTAVAWKPDSGYGKLNALRAYQLLTAKPLAINTPAKQNKGWAYGMTGANESHDYTVQAKKGQRLILTVTWHRKLQKIGHTFLEEFNRFYLDLKILSPKGKMLWFETPGRNNLIKTDLLIKEDGQYTISLKNPTLAENRDYGLAFELSP